MRCSVTMTACQAAAQHCSPNQESFVAGSGLALLLSTSPSWRILIRAMRHLHSLPCGNQRAPLCTKPHAHVEPVQHNTFLSPCLHVLNVDEQWLGKSEVHQARRGLHWPAAGGSAGICCIIDPLDAGFC